MTANIYSFHIDDASIEDANRSANSLADILRAAAGVSRVDRKKSSADTMDVGTIISVVASSGATIAIAEGIAAWLRARRGVILTVDSVSGSESLKTSISGIDPVTAERIIEKIIESRPE